MRVTGWFIGFIVIAVIQAFLILALFRNSRRHKKSKHALAKSEARFRTSFDADAIGRTLTGTDGKLFLVNRRLCEMLGYSREEFATLSFVAITHPDDLAASREAVRSLLTGEQNVCQLEKRYLRKNGSQLWTEMTTTLLRDEQGRPLHFITSILDISQRKQAEEALQESEANYRFVLDAMRESLSIIDGDGTFLFANATAAKNLIEGEVKDVVGKNIRQLVPEEQGQNLLAVYRRTIETGEPLQQEIAVTLPQGKRWFYNTLQPVQYKQHSAKAVLSISLDITERKQAEEDKNLLQKQLQHAQKMEAIGTLAGGIAHDFNNILAAILGYAELIREDLHKNSIRTHDIDQILLAGNRAKDLVKHILAFSRQMKEEKIPMQPAFVIKEAIKLLRASLPSTISIKQEIDPHTAAILADPTQIHQLTINLCTNAFHAMEQKGGTLTISLGNLHLPADTAGGKDFVRLSIHDTGTGISPEIREHIFDPYFTTKEVGKGTGMGLAIVHGIITSYNGTITCDSPPGLGTTFHITLPALTDQPQPTDTPKNETMPPVGSERILLIDDEEILANMTRTMLEKLGYQVTVRRSSLEALTTFQNQPDAYDLVITDQTMPGMTGIDLARRMLQLRPDLPIILCTGYSSLISEDKAKSAGIRGFALKPLAKKDLAVLIRRVLGKATE